MANSQNEVRTQERTFDSTCEQQSQPSKPIETDLILVHINLHGSPLASATLNEYMSDQKNYLISVNEPSFNQQVTGLNCFRNVTKVNSSHRISALVLSGGPDVQVCKLTQFTNTYCAAVEVKYKNQNFYFVSIYLHPTRDLEESLGHLQTILNNTNLPVIVMSDTNCRHQAWLDVTSNPPRSTTLIEFLLKNNLVIANETNTPTFYTVRDQTVFSSLVDLCICNQAAYRLVGSCNVDKKNDSDSDHRYLVTHLISVGIQPGKRILQTTRKYCNKGADWNKFKSDFSELISAKPFLLEELDSKRRIDEAVKMIDQSIQTACKLNLKRYSCRSVKKVVLLDWEIRTAKTVMRTAEKRWKGSTNHLISEHNWKLYRAAKKCYKDLFKLKKRNSWRSLCESVDSASVYSLFSSTKPRNKAPIATVQIEDGVYTQNFNETVDHLLNTHFPNNNQPVVKQPTIRMTAKQFEEIQLATNTEIYNAFKSFNPNKALGQDGLTSEIIVKCLEAVPNLLTNLFNSALKLGYFPDAWKVGVVCMIPKDSNSEVQTAKMSRPITLINITSKAFEKLINSRLAHYLHLSGQLSEKQFGFTKQKSCLDACERLMEKLEQLMDKEIVPLIISFDIAGAFDSASWEIIVQTMKEMNCPAYLINLIASYLYKRKVKLLGTDRTISLSQGSPQGSCLGPLLWNILINSLLNSNLFREEFGQAFADDLIIVMGIEELTRELEMKIEKQIKAIFDWGARNHLKFNAKKTQAMLVTKKIDCEQLTFHVYDQKITTGDQLEYLGLLLDPKLTFIPHLNSRIEKATKSILYLKRICSRTYGLNTNLAKLLYRTVVKPKLFYLCEIWADRCRLISVVKKLRAFQRTNAIMVIKSFRTVRRETSIMILDEQPLDTEILMRYCIRKVKKYGNLNGAPVETRTNWLDCTPEWQFEEVSRVEYEDELLTDYDLQVYTDGSNRENLVGSAYVINSEDEQIVQNSYKLPEHCSVIQSELVAIRQAVVKLIEMNLTNKRIIFLTDSQNAISKINNMNRQNELTIEIRNRISVLDQSNVVDFCWIKSHIGEQLREGQEPPGYAEGNDYADRLAKEGAQQEEISDETSDLTREVTFLTERNR